MEWRTKDHEACRGCKLTGDEICSTGKAFDVVLTDDHDAVSVRNIEDEERDSRRFSECARRWFKCTV